MRAHSLISCATTFAVLWVLSATPGVLARQNDAAALGTVRIPKTVIADGQPLPAGTYAVRLSDESVTPVVGQGGSEHWVEFVQRGEVKGRELSSVVEPAAVSAVAKGTPPKPGTSRVQMLRSGEYLRLWFNRGGTNYLVHLGVQQ